MEPDDPRGQLLYELQRSIEDYQWLKQQGVNLEGVLQSNLPVVLENELSER